MKINTTRYPSIHETRDVQDFVEAQLNLFEYHGAVEDASEKTERLAVVFARLVDLLAEKEVLLPMEIVELVDGHAESARFLPSPPPEDL